MKNAEDLLYKAKEEFNELRIPDHMEQRLREALNRPVKKRKGTRWIAVAALILLLSLSSYHFNTLAFYGKKILGYDNVMSSTLSNLNELYKGQQIEKSYEFSNGTKFTLDGIMLDDNQLVAFYKISAGKGGMDEISSGLSPAINLKSMFDDKIMNSSYGVEQKDKNEIQYVGSFNTPFFLAKSLKLNFSMVIDGVSQQGSISFDIDRSKAMGHTLKKSIKKTIKVDGVNLRLQDILASATKTSITGTVQNIFELGYDQIRGERIRPADLQFQLIANGKIIEGQGGHISTNLNGITFGYDYAPLPEKLVSLELKLVSFGVDHDVNEVIDINANESNKTINLLNQALSVDKIKQSNGITEVTITSKESVVLTRIYLLADAKTVKLEKTVDLILNKSSKGEITKTRTLIFNSTGKKLQLDIKRMTYIEKYDKVVEIPID